MDVVEVEEMEDGRVILYVTMTKEEHGIIFELGFNAALKQGIKLMQTKEEE